MRTPYLSCLIVLGLAAPAVAQEPDDSDDTGLQGANPDPSPDVPEPLERGGDAQLDVVEQTGVGGRVAYGSAGVLEVGGTGSLFATDDTVGLRFAPYAGWFVLDGLQLTYFHDVLGGKNDNETYFGTFTLLEISCHLPINDRLLVMLGGGGGYLYNGDEHGFGMKARLGLDVLVGRSGIFRPAFFALWGSAPIVPQVATVPRSKWGYGLEISYGVMF